MSKTADTFEWPEEGQQVTLTWLGQQKHGRIVSKDLSKEFGEPVQWVYTIRLKSGQTIRQSEEEINVV
jgi:hypothetical protein